MDEVLTTGDVSSSLPAATAGTASAPVPPSNLPLVSAFLAFSIAQFLKLFTTWCVPAVMLLCLHLFFFVFVFGALFMLVVWFLMCVVVE